MDQTGLRSIGEVCAETGLTVDVVRAWERRYGFPVSQRLPTGHRRYGEDVVARLKLMAQAVTLGHKPSMAAYASEADLRQLILPDGNTRVEALFKGVAAMDPDLIRRLLRQNMQELGWEPFLLKVASPLLDRVGIAWADGEIGIHHEHLISELLEDFLRTLRQEFHSQPGRGKVLLCTLPGERHRLGLLMAALAHAALGARTEVLGEDVPIANIAEAAATLKVDKVAVSMSVYFTGEPARGLLLELRERLPEGCRLVIGGKGAARLRQVPGIRKTKELCVG
jgi:MerR family transcriptional regulator, light-induced transcriptional regulator